VIKGTIAASDVAITLNGHLESHDRGAACLRGRAFEALRSVPGRAEGTLWTKSLENSPSCGVQKMVALFPFKRCSASNGIHHYDHSRERVLIRGKARQM